MKRSKRDKEWDNYSLDYYPTEDISPVNISPDTEHTYLPNSVINLYDVLENWIKEIYRRTKETGNEHGFYVDFYGNVIGIIEGDRNSVTWPKDHKISRALLVHTHPAEDPVFSQTDLDSFNNMNDRGAQAVLTVPENTVGAGLFYLNKVDTDNDSLLTSGPMLVKKWADDCNNRIYEARLDPFETLHRYQISMGALKDVHEFIKNLIIMQDATLTYSYRHIRKRDLEY